MFEINLIYQKVVLFIGQEKNSTNLKRLIPKNRERCFFAGRSTNLYGARKKSDFSLRR